MSGGDDIEIFQGSGNVFADLERPYADESILKANLTAELRRLIAERRLTQTTAAKILGIAQADLSKLLRGSLRGCSVARLMAFLTAFDQDVEVIVRPRDKADESGTITFTLETA